MHSVFKHMHILQKVYIVPPPNKLMISNSYQLGNTNLKFKKTLVMPLFTIKVAQGLPKSDYRIAHIQNPLKRKLISDCDTTVLMSCSSMQAAYRTTTIYKARDGIDQIFRYLSQQDHTYMINLSILNQFVPQNELHYQIVFALEQLNLIDKDKLEFLQQNNTNWKLFDQNAKPQNLISNKYNQSLYNILFDNFEFTFQQWKQQTRIHGIINAETLNNKQFGVQMHTLYYLKFNNPSENTILDIIKLNKYLIEDFDMFEFLKDVEQNDKKIRIYMLRIIKNLQLTDQQLVKFIQYCIKSYSVTWTKSCIKQLKLNLLYFVR